MNAPEGPIRATSPDHVHEAGAAGSALGGGGSGDVNLRLAQLEAENRELRRLLEVRGLGLPERDVCREWCWPAGPATPEGEPWMEAAARAAGIGFWAWDLVTDRVCVSREWRMEMGYEVSPENSNPEDWMSGVHPEDLPGVLAKVKDCRGGAGSHYSWELRMRTQGGDYRWISALGVVLRDGSGKPIRIVGCHVDITDRRRGEDELRRSRELLEQTGVVAGVGGWEFDLQTQELRWSPQTCRIHGVPVGHGPTVEEAIGYYAPEAREVIRAAVERGIAEGVPWDLELPIITADGRRVWVRAQGQADAGRDGRTTRLFGAFHDITRRKEDEKALLLTQFTFMNASLEIFWIKPDGTFFDVNAAAARALGYEREELLRMRAGEVNRRYTEDRWREHWEELRRRGSMTFTARQQRKDGSELDVEVSAHFLNFGGEELNCCFVQDITARKRAEEADRKNSERMRAIIETEPECIKIVSLDGRLMEMNPAGLRMLGADDASCLAGRPILEMIHPEDRVAFQELHRVVAQGGAGTLEFRVIGLKGVELWMETHSVPLREADGTITSVLSVTRDVTARRKAEEERRQLEAQLLQSQKMEAVGTLAGGIAHDFNNILATILCNLELLRMDLAGRAAECESLGEIRMACERARTLVQQILAFSRPQIRELRPLSLQSVVVEAARFIRSTIPTRVSVEVSVDADAPLVMANATQMHQVLVNLCTNAWHALEERPGQIEIALRNADLDAAAAAKLDGLQPGKHSCLVVSDNGCGMSPASLRRIFEPFYTTKGVGRGTGLGLSVVHGIVRSLRGAIDVVSELGKGSIFRVYLPATAGADTGPAESETIRRGGGHSILYLDDEEALGRATIRILERLGYRVTGFSRPERALEAFRMNPAAYDLVMADFEMPGLTGLAVAEEILAVRPGVPIVLCSGYLTLPIRRKAVELGIRHFLTKPCEMAQISQLLASMLTVASPNAGAGAGSGTHSP